MLQLGASSQKRPGKGGCPEMSTGQCWGAGGRGSGPVTPRQPPEAGCGVAGEAGSRVAYLSQSLLVPLGKARSGGYGAEAELQGVTSHPPCAILSSAAGLLGSPVGQAPAYIPLLATCSRANSCPGASLAGTGVLVWPIYWEQVASGGQGGRNPRSFPSFSLLPPGSLDSPTHSKERSGPY